MSLSAVTNCTDINDVSLDTIQFNTDGTVLGVLVIDGIETTTNLSYDCCTANGYTFDPTDTKCYWSDSCLVGGAYQIILDPEGNTGALFQVDENQDVCHLEVEFDYLIRFDCDLLSQPLKDTIESLKLQLSIQKVIYDESLPIPDNLVEVQTEDLFNVTNAGEFFSGNTNTGILLSGDCDSTIVNLITDLGVYGDTITDISLSSNWVRHTMIIDDPEILESIYNERLKVVIKGTNLTDFAILIDNIELNRVCDTDDPPLFLDEECPKFELKRVIDNKKSWVKNTTTELREFDLSRRDTSYSINHEKLSINTKEIDLLINPSQAIENDILDFVTTNTCLLDPATGCTATTVTEHSCVDISELITTPVSGLTNTSDLLNELIDVKSRKTISSYPTIELLLHRYNNSQEHCGVISNALDSESVNTFVNLIGNFWTELIEQVVPATTIWGSSFSHGDNDFGRNKFVYRKSSLLLCNDIDNQYPSPISGASVNTIEVITSDVTSPTAKQVCEVAYIRQANDGSEFIGTVITTDGPTTTGNTISITETITDDCGKYETCN
jgi:hypothetical protein